MFAGFCIVQLSYVNSCYLEQNLAYFRRKIRGSRENKWNFNTGVYLRSNPFSEKWLQQQLSDFVNKNSRAPCKHMVGILLTSSANRRPLTLFSRGKNIQKNLDIALKKAGAKMVFLQCNHVPSKRASMSNTIQHLT